VLREAGLPETDELILRRVNTRDGRKTAWINDRRASGEVLRQLSDTLVELHGQQDDRGLLNPRGHRAARRLCRGGRAHRRDPRARGAALGAARKALAPPRRARRRCAPKRNSCATRWPSSTRSTRNRARSRRSTPGAG
jgi:DNA repair protein RecN (Recombination protein N)